MSDPQNYTVGWICAIPTEFAAARAFLDEQHPGPEATAQNDNNTYALGTMGKHNVVIAVMPKREYGIAAAATVARDMVHSFPNVRIGLMVGVGGGAPSQQHDIRLGDVVVGCRGAGNGGVIQYDYGKAMQNQAFVETGSLNQPPPALLNAVVGLETDYMMEGPELNAKVDMALDQWKRLRKTHSRPPASTDQLYKSEFIHILDPSAACSQGCDVDDSNVVSRRERGEDDDNPAIHYGLIASANQVMKNAEIRDKLSRDKDVLCFEMEAAGLMNHFPCLVVRGVCDYSDSHKNKEWQGFAAMSAAAYAKDLLRRISPHMIAAEKKIKEVLESMEGSLARIGSTTDEIKSRVDMMSSDSHIQKIKNWLSPPDTSTNSNHARESRHKGTGSWFLESAAFKEWERGSRQHLWLYGIPGSGKTVLITTVLDHLAQMDDRVTLDFFFDFSDINKQNPEDMCRALAFQLYIKRIKARKELDSLFASHDDGRKQPTIQTLCQCLQAMMQAHGRLCIVLDALDECIKRTELLRWMQSFISSSCLPHVQLIATGRPEEEFMRDFRSWISESSCVPLERESIDADIQSYISTRLASKEFSKWISTPSILQQIQEEVGGKADGMFRWAACQLDSLETCLDREEIEAALKALPQDLNETYARILQNIPQNRRKKAIRLLQFLVHSVRPLTLQVAIDVMAVRLDERRSFDPEDRLPNPMDITRFCPSLAVLIETPGATRAGGALQLAHFTVKEYLLYHNAEGFCGIEPSISITQTCLFYLTSMEEDEVLKMRDRYPLARYAAEIWMDHAKQAESSDDSLVAITDFLQNMQGLRVWARLFDPERPWDDNPKHPIASGFYYACLKGLTATVKRLLSNQPNVNAQGGYYGNALQAASLGGHTEVVQILLNKGADVNAQGGSYGNALQAASSKGHTEIVQILLNKGADVNAQGGFYDNALYAAISNGCIEIASLFLDKCSLDLEYQNPQSGQTVLSYAAAGGYESILKLLLTEHHVVPNPRDNIGRTPLFLASNKGHETAVSLLLERESVAPDWKDHYGSTPLSVAARKGHVEVVKSLLATELVDINSQDVFGRTPMWWARSCGHSAISQMLLETGNLRGISLDDSQMDLEDVPRYHNTRARCCDICTFSIAEDSWYHCSVCNCGNFDICLDCFNCGGRCLGKSHELILEQK